MTSPSGTCPFCGGKTEQGTTTFTADLGFGVVVVRDVPALICAQCGEAWFEDGVAEKLEKVVHSAREHGSDVEVTRWDQIAA